MREKWGRDLVVPILNRILHRTLPKGYQYTVMYLRSI